MQLILPASQPMSDTCALCKRQIYGIIIHLPAEYPDTSYRMACLICAEKHPSYCTIHKMPHRKSADGCTYCYLCTRSPGPTEEETARIIKQIRDLFSPQEVAALLKRAANEYPWLSAETAAAKMLLKAAVFRGLPLERFLREPKQGTRGFFTTRPKQKEALMEVLPLLP